MRSEHSWIRAGESPGRTAPYQVGVSFTHHRGAVFEAGHRTTQCDIPAGAVFVTGAEAITWMRVREHTEALEIFPDPELLGELTLDRLAGVAMLSPFHFARSFKVTTGLAPHQFVTARRMERAKSLLLDSPRAVTDVAYAVGFSNIGHFRRTFRRHFGVNPGVLRNAARTAS